MSLPKIKSVQLYQAARFDNKMDTFFTTIESSTRKAVSIKMIEGIGVLISNKKDEVIIPFPNIGAIYILTDHFLKEKDDKKQAAVEYEKTKTVLKPSKMKKDPIGSKRM